MRVRTQVKEALLLRIEIDFLHKREDGVEMPEESGRSMPEPYFKLTPWWYATAYGSEGRTADPVRANPGFIVATADAETPELAVKALMDSLEIVEP